MKGLVQIEGMEFFAYHGCYETERIVGNKFRVDISIQVDCDKAAESDDVNDALNYVTVYQITDKEMKITSNLLENVAKRIVDSIYEQFPQVENLKVKVSKMNPPLGGKIHATCVTLEK